MSLTEKKCTPCQGGTEPMPRERAEGYMDQVPGWELTHDATRLQRKFKFKNFAQANAFVDKVGELAESEDHHPDITFGYGYAIIEISTHKIKGLHENDFIFAAKTNELAGE
ncbi:4a-hydroxytetrahydrobiopterin dehydratase [Aquisalimonas lutea]|uniref:4a-hydroxytetrahydrobiopterin dehydratase n=1 Tax=Aquisalimonas lutea TaxID=1327750 RepID=UPI0025B4CD48|nr:4a-hydroxytetrahydrobiopterin dehydratase [Aquisalimonas lutea]MDN3518645.1 4a-hydroxytetrahydrobiopterin dehydratase [Aquisalimonas lutea]